MATPTEVDEHVAPTSSPRGIAAAVGAVTAWGLGNTIIAGVPMSGMAIAFYRLLLAVAIYVPVLYLRGGRLTARSFRHGWVGGVAFGADIATFFVAIHLTTVANATTISALQPLVIMGFAAVMFGERIRSRHVVCAVTATVGRARSPNRSDTPSRCSSGRSVGPTSHSVCSGSAAPGNPVAADG